MNGGTDGFGWAELHPTVGTCWRGGWPSGTVEPNRRTFDFELVFFASGRCRVITGGGTRTAEAGSVLILPPDLVHCTVADTRVTRWCVHFDWRGDCPLHGTGGIPYVFSGENRPFPAEWVAAAPEGFPADFPFFRRLPEADLPGFRRLSDALFEESGGPTGPLRRNGVLAEVLAWIFADCPDGASEGNPLRRGGMLFRAKERLDAGVEDAALRIEDVASELGITPNHLAKLFRRELGQPPRAYLLNRRLSLAESLLAGGGVSVREAAFRCGFDDANYFSRVFRRKRGQSPSVWRSRQPGGAVPRFSAGKFNS